MCVLFFDYYVCDPLNRGNVSGTALVIASPTHPMAAGLSGTVTVSNVSGNIAWGYVTTAADKVAHVPSYTSRAVIAGYAAGDEMYQGVTAPSRRVLYGIGPDPGIANATWQGRALFDAAIGWVTQVNLAPVVNAGSDRTAQQATAGGAVSVNLDGTVSDDGLPTPPSLTTTWSVVSGPGSVTVSNPSAVDTPATFTVAGYYTLRLTGNDGERQASDDVVVRILLPNSSNTAPVVNAGSDQTVAYPAAASLGGTVVDDGLPFPPSTVTVTWSKVSGPGTVTFGSATSLSTTATFSSFGTYVLRLTANDSSLLATDDLVINVQGRVLMVVGSTTLSAGDNYMKTRLPALGYTVATKLASQSSSADASGRELIILSNTCSTADVLDKFRAVAVPVITMFTGIYDDMALTTTADRWVPTGKQLTIQNPMHPLAANLKGTVSVTTNATSLAAGKPNANGVKVANVPGLPDQNVVFGYLAGAPMVDGFVAPARRVGFGVYADPGLSSVTTDGQALFDAAVKWATKQNLPPSVDAGLDKTVPVHQTVTLTGTAGDDGSAGTTDPHVQVGEGERPGIGGFRC